MLAVVVKFLLGFLAQESVREVMKVGVKSITKNTETTIDDDIVDIVFDSKSTEDLARKSINYGAKKLKDSVSDGIKDTDVSNFLDKALTSNQNGVNPNIKDKVVKSITSNKKRAYVK